MFFLHSFNVLKILTAVGNSSNWRSHSRIQFVYDKDQQRRTSAQATTLQQWNLLAVKRLKCSKNRSVCQNNHRRLSYDGAFRCQKVRECQVKQWWKDRSLQTAFGWADVCVCAVESFVDPWGSPWLKCCGAVCTTHFSLFQNGTKNTLTNISFLKYKLSLRKYHF